MFSGHLTITVVSAEDLPAPVDAQYNPRASISQLFARLNIKIDGQVVAETGTIENCDKPEWGETFENIDINEDDKEMCLSVCHESVTKESVTLADCRLLIPDLVQACRTKKRLTQQLDPKGTLVLDVNFEEQEEVQMKRQGKVAKMFPVKGHRFVMKTLLAPVYCAHDRDFIWGLGNKALECKNCSMTIHTGCLDLILPFCKEVQASMPGVKSPITPGLAHTFKKTNFYRPSWCNHCGRFMVGLRGQGYTCSADHCVWICHAECRENSAHFCGTDMAVLSRILDTIKKQQEKKQEENKRRSQERDSKRPSKPAEVKEDSKTCSLDDFTLKAVLGKGAFGKVFLAEVKKSRQIVAIKAVEKSVIVEGEDIAITLLERDVLTLGQQAGQAGQGGEAGEAGQGGDTSRFLTSLLASFQTPERLFFVMEFLGGGDLMHHIMKSRRFSEPRAQFYTAEIVLALQFLHTKGVIYRDLKLDNVMLTTEGHVKLADFGMCKRDMVNGVTKTFCGTPNYIAPEIIAELEYGYSVDWWALGVLLFEMLIGRSPFMSQNEDELFRMIREDDVKFPARTPVSKPAKQLINSLLTKDPGQRLGPGEDRLTVREQDFFQGIDWKELEQGKTEPHFKPDQSSDTCCFDAEFTGEKPHLEPIKIDPSFKLQCREGFKGFSFVSEGL